MMLRPVPCCQLVGRGHQSTYTCMWHVETCKVALNRGQKSSELSTSLRSSNWMIIVSQPHLVWLVRLYVCYSRKAETSVVRHNIGRKGRIHTSETLAWPPEASYWPWKVPEAISYPLNSLWGMTSWIPPSYSMLTHKLVSSYVSCCMSWKQVGTVMKS